MNCYSTFTSSSDITGRRRIAKQEPEHLIMNRKKVIGLNLRHEVRSDNPPNNQICPPYVSKYSSRFGSTVRGPGFCKFVQDPFAEPVRLGISAHHTYQRNTEVATTGPVIRVLNFFGVGTGRRQI